MNAIQGITFESSDGHTVAIRLRTCGARSVLVLSDDKGQRFEIGDNVQAFRNLAAAINFVAERNK